jgi:hypothetical protein
MTDENTIDCPKNRIIVFNEYESMPSIPYENEFFDDPNHRCHDCNVKLGSYHHPGCDMERCPKCGGQLISCDCIEEDWEDES